MLDLPHPTAGNPMPYFSSRAIGTIPWSVTGLVHCHLEVSACHRHPQAPIPRPSQTCPYNTIASHPIIRHRAEQLAAPTEPPIAPPGGGLSDGWQWYYTDRFGWVLVWVPEGGGKPQPPGGSAPTPSPTKG